MRFVTRDLRNFKARASESTIVFHALSGDDQKDIGASRDVITLLHLCQVAHATRKFINLRRARCQRDAHKTGNRSAHRHVVENGYLIGDRSIGSKSLQPPLYGGDGKPNLGTNGRCDTACIMLVECEGSSGLSRPFGAPFELTCGQTA